MRSFVVYIQMPPVENGRKVQQVVFDDGVRRIIEVKDHEAHFREIGTVVAGSGERALQTAKAMVRDSSIHKLLAVAPVEVQ